MLSKINDGHETETEWEIRQNSIMSPQSQISQSLPYGWYVELDIVETKSSSHLPDLSG